MNNEVSAGSAGVCHSVLRVIGKFELVVGSRTIDLSANCRRLLTLLAIRGGQVSRASAAGTLWPDAPAARASANLRSALWKLHRCCPEVVEASFHVIRLAPGVRVDIKEAGQVARSLLDRSVTRTPHGLSEALNCDLHEDIVPDLGDEEWLAAERERHRQLRLHALESLSEDLIVTGWHGAAAETALSVIRADPFRESARQLLVRAYLAEGNQLEAHRQHRQYRNLMRQELGLEPTDQFLKLVPVPDVAGPPPGRPRPVPHRQPVQPVAGPGRQPMRVL